jgi:hypothetical protein
MSGVPFYEAGSTGYGLYRRDAVELAKLLRAGEATAVGVPDERHEAMRDLSRAHGVMRLTDVVGGKLLAERLGERDEAGLGGGIGGGLRIALLAGDGGDVDHAAVALGDHAWDDGPAAVERAIEFDGHDLPRGIQRILPRGLRRSANPGVIDQDVDATEFIERRIACPLDSCGVSHIHGEGYDPAAALQCPGGLFGKAAVAVRDCDRRARGEEALGDGTADAAPPVTVTQRRSSPVRRPYSAILKDALWRPIAASASATTAIVRRRLDGLTLMESMPRPAR